MVYAAAALQMANYTIASAQAMAAIDTAGLMSFRSSSAVNGEVWHEGSVTYPLGA